MLPRNCCSDLFALLANRQIALSSFLPMRTTTIVTGVLLFLLGPLFFLLGAAGHRSFTAFIPSIFGVIILACGLIATTPKKTKMALHIAVVVALLGFLGSLFGKNGLSVPGWIAALTGNSADPRAAFSQMLMFLFCGFYVVRSVLWFLGNRASRSAA